MIFRGFEGFIYLYIHTLYTNVINSALTITCSPDLFVCSDDFMFITNPYPSIKRALLNLELNLN